MFGILLKVSLNSWFYELWNHKWYFFITLKPKFRPSMMSVLLSNTHSNRSLELVLSPSILSKNWLNASVNAVVAFNIIIYLMCPLWTTDITWVSKILLMILKYYPRLTILSEKDYQFYFPFWIQCKNAQSLLAHIEESRPLNVGSKSRYYSKSFYVSFAANHARLILFYVLVLTN